MTFQVFDMMGEEIKVDDHVAAAFSYSSSADLRIGKVVELKVTFPDYSGPNYYVRVQWIQGGYIPHKPTLIGVKPNDKSNLLKVNINGIN